MFKIGDLVKLDATYHPERHPPMGTIGVVIHIEDWGDIIRCGDDVEQFIRVHWAGGPNTDEQCYADSRLKMVKAC
jgi:hypothetical protein